MVIIGEALFSGIFEWAKEELPAPDVDSELWNLGLQDILEKYKNNGNVSFIWNGEDMSFLRFDMTRQAEYLDDTYNIINLMGGAPRVPLNSSSPAKDF